MDPEPKPTLSMDPEPGVSQMIQKWAGYSSETASDSELLDMVGIHGDNIPSWVKEMVLWINHDEISEQEFLDVIYYLHKTDLIY